MGDDARRGQTDGSVGLRHFREGYFLDSDLHLELTPCPHNTHPTDAPSSRPAGRMPVSYPALHPATSDAARSKAGLLSDDGTTTIINRRCREPAGRGFGCRRQGLSCYHRYHPVLCSYFQQRCRATGQVLSQLGVVVLVQTSRYCELVIWLSHGSDMTSKCQVRHVISLLPAASLTYYALRPAVSLSVWADL